MRDLSPEHPLPAENLGKIISVLQTAVDPDGRLLRCI